MTIITLLDASTWNIIITAAIFILAALVCFHIQYVEKKYGYSLFSGLYFGMSILIIIGFFLVYHNYNLTLPFSSQKTIYPYIGIFLLFFGNLGIFVTLP